MNVAAHYPDISLKIFFGFAAAIAILAILFFVGRRVPRTRVPAAFLFGLALGVALDRLNGEIHQRRLDDRVLAAAGKGDSVALRSALDSGGSPMADEPTSGGWPALGSALYSGNSQAVELLLQRGADPSYGNLDSTSIEIAKKARRPDLVRLLERYGAK